MAGILVHMTEKYIFRYMRNCFWLLRNNYPKKHATSNRNINAYDRGLYLLVEIQRFKLWHFELQIRFNNTFSIVFNLRHQ